MSISMGIQNGMGPKSYPSPNGTENGILTMQCLGRRVNPLIIWKYVMHGYYILINFVFHPRG